MHASLLAGRILGHDFVLGELACGNLRNRREVLDLYRKLPRAEQAEHDEVLHLIEQKELYGTGIGWIDAHLLASARLTRSRFWTLDKVLSRTAKAMGLAVG